MKNDAGHPYVEIAINKAGFRGTTVKINGQEVYVSALRIDLDGPGIPKVDLTFIDKADIKMACHAETTLRLVDAQLSLRRKGAWWRMRREWRKFKKQWAKPSELKQRKRN